MSAAVAGSPAKVVVTAVHNRQLEVDHDVRVGDEVLEVNGEPAVNAVGMLDTLGNDVTLRLSTSAAAENRMQEKIYKTPKGSQLYPDEFRHLHDVLVMEVG
jgi:hypothetical protein